MFNRKNLITLGVLSAIALVLVAFIATNAYRGHRKKVEDQRLAAFVADATIELRHALFKTPSGASLTKLEDYLQTAKSSPNVALGSAAEHYLLSAREITRRRVDAERFGRQAATSRQALTVHMSRSAGRGPGWIQQATDLKRRVEADHAELSRSLKALEELLTQFPEAGKRIAPHVAAEALIDMKEIEAARVRTQEVSKNAASELERVRRLTP
jgi:hypothetical protein